MKVHANKLNKKEKVAVPAVCPDESDPEAMQTEYKEKIALGEALYKLIEQWGGEEAALSNYLKEALDVYMKQGDVEFGQCKPCSENAPLDLDEQDNQK